MPELSFTVTGAPIISLRKPLGSLESPAASGAGLSPLVDMFVSVGRCVIGQARVREAGDEGRWDVGKRTGPSDFVAAGR